MRIQILEPVDWITDPDPDPALFIGCEDTVRCADDHGSPEKKNHRGLYIGKYLIPFPHSHRWREGGGCNQN
jgi:hypothetical protein